MDERDNDMSKIKKVLNKNFKKIFQRANADFLATPCQPESFDLPGNAVHYSTRYMNVVLGGNGIAQRKVNGKFKDCEKKLPELYDRKENCCGCSACYAICPLSGKNRPEIIKSGNDDIPLSYKFVFSENITVIHEHTGAITMMPDEEGFLYPVVDAEICTRCYKCISVCAFKAKHY